VEDLQRLLEQSQAQSHTQLQSQAQSQTPAQTQMGSLRIPKRLAAPLQGFMAPASPPPLPSSDVRSGDFQPSHKITGSNPITQLTDDDFTSPTTFDETGTMEHPSAGAGSGVSGVRAGASAGASAVQGPTSSEALERLLQTAKGYEWNERYMSVDLRENDGYASLSIEPDGKGYLGE
jgi:hypothetical protein